MSVRTMLMIVSLALSVIIGLVLARGGGGDTARKGESVRIGLSLDTLKEARWQADRDMFVAEATARGADEIAVQSANGDDIQQMKDVESLLTRGIDVLVIVPHDGKAMAQAVERAKRENVPVIAYDRLIVDCDLDLYLSFDNVRVGELQAEYLVKSLPTPGKGRIVRIYGAPTDNNARLFKQGQDNILKPYIDRGDIVVVHEDWAEDWRPENAKKITNAAITKAGRGFEGVLASNDGTAGGAIQALMEEGIAGNIIVTGQDAELAACQRIANGTQAMTIYKPLKRLATRAADVSVRMAQGRPVIANSSVNNGAVDVPSILEDVIIVTRDNLVDTVIRDGFQPYDKVFQGVPESQRPPQP